MGAASGAASCQPAQPPPAWPGPTVDRWASTIAGMGPDQRAKVLESLPEDDRMTVQRILDANSIRSTPPPPPPPTQTRIHSRNETKRNETKRNETKRNETTDNLPATKERFRRFGCCGSQGDRQPWAPPAACCQHHAARIAASCLSHWV